MFIGAGGTMTREMAVLGIPTISVYQDELLDVDRYLLEVGAFSHKPQLTAAEALEYLEHATQQPPNRDLLRKGKDAYDLVQKFDIEKGVRESDKTCSCRPGKNGLVPPRHDPRPPEGGGGCRV